MKDIATISTTKYILEKYQLNALKKYGQNFLIDKQVVEKIVACAHIDQQTAVIEVGPGIGALTQILSRYASRVRAYEIDQRFAVIYQEFLPPEKVEVIFDDFLKVDLKQIRQWKKKDERVVLVANLPYYITTNIIEKVILENSVIDEIVVMVQKEVAQKYTSDYQSPLTLMIQDMGKIEYMFTVSQHVFIPAPHVDSAIMKITLNQSADHQLYDVLKVCFQQRRKTIYNNLKKVYPHADTILDACQIDKNKRCEQLSLADFKNITKNIK